MAIDSFIFGGNTGLTYEQLKRRRAVAAALASQRRGFPKTVGEGLTYLGESIGDTIAERRLDAAERAMAAGDRAALNPPTTATAAPAAPPAAAARPAGPPSRPALPPAPVRPPPVAAPAAAAPPMPVLPSGPSSEAMTSGPPPNEFAMGGILNAAPMGAPNLEPVFPGEEGIPSQAAGILPSSGYLPPAATAAAPPPNLPAPTAAPTAPNYMDEAGWPTGPRRDLLSTETGAAGAPNRVESQPSGSDRGGRLPGPQSGLTDFIARQEGFRPSSYWDYKQYSIGHGTRGQPGETITREEGRRRLESEVANARQEVENFAPDAPPGVKDALTSLTYNAGSGWQQAGLGRLIREGRYDEARERFAQYNKAGGSTLPGLVSRRNAELSSFWDQAGGDEQEARTMLASLAPTGGAGAPIPGMGSAGAPRLQPQIPPLQGPPDRVEGRLPPAPEEQVTPTDIEPAPATAQFGPPAGQFTRSDAPVPGLPTAPTARPPMQAGAAVPPPIEPMDPGPEPRPPAPTAEMQHWRSVGQDLNRSDQTRALAQGYYDEALKAQREDFKNQWTIWKTEKLKFDDPATRLQLRHSQLANERAVRDLEGEGFRPLTPEELKGLPTPPPGQIVYANRRGELKFGPTPPASTTVNIDQKATGKGQEKLQEKMAEQFVEMFTAGTTAADDLRTITEMRELTARVNTGPEAVAKQFAGRWGIKTEGISNIEALNAMINRVVPQQRVPGAGATSDFDARMFQQSVPALMNTPGGNVLIMDTMEGVARNKMARAEVAGKVVSGQLTIAEGVKETLALQTQARAMSDRVKDHLEKGGAGAATTGPTMSRENQRALDWATQNPTDPRAQEIKKRLGVP